MTVDTLPEKLPANPGRESRHPALRLLRRTAVGLVCILLSALFFGPLVFIIGMTWPVRYHDSLSYSPMQEIYTPEEFGITARDTTLVTADGLHLWASLVEPERPRGIVILLTGIRQPSITYYYGHAAWLQSQGYASLLLELRGHGRSQGNRVGLGFTETEDVRAAVAYIRSLPGYEELPILLQGVSMGGAVAINAFSALPEIAGLVAESPYSSMSHIARDLFRRYDAPEWFVSLEGKVVDATLYLIYGEAAETQNPIDRIGSIDRPTMLIASAGDPGVPVENACRLLNAAGPSCRLWIREGNAHFIVRDNDLLHMAEDDEYCTRLLAFYDSLCPVTAENP